MELVGKHVERYTVQRYDGTGRGDATKYHAVSRRTGAAACGTKPRGWYPEEGGAVTCARCISILTNSRPPRSPTQLSWDTMKKRCLYRGHGAYNRYGGAGVKVCDRWSGPKGFENFLADMGERPQGKTLDRIDSSGDYCPENCRWATAKEQQRNRRDRKELTAFGRSQSLPEWAEEYGLNEGSLNSRLKRGWPLERALTEPFEPHRGGAHAREPRS